MSSVHRPLPPRPISAIRLDGGRLSLDFINTIHNRYAVDVEDYLPEPRRFIEWCVRAGALGPDDAVSTPRAAHKRRSLMREVVVLRDHLHALFAARIDDVQPPQDAVRGL